MKDYIENAIQTESQDYEKIMRRFGSVSVVRLVHASMGLCTESGELLDAVKKYLFYGKPVDDVNVQEELGDIFWYAAILADASGYTFEDTMEKNIAKLKARYPDKFTEKDAQLRNLEKERQILED